MQSLLELEHVSDSAEMSNIVIQVYRSLVEMDYYFYNPPQSPQEVPPSTFTL